MKLVLLRYTDKNGQRVYWPISLSSAEAVGVAARLEDPELVVIEVPEAIDLAVLFSASVRVVSL